MTPENVAVRGARHTLPKRLASRGRMFVCESRSDPVAGPNVDPANVWRPPQTATLSETATRTGGKTAQTAPHHPGQTFIAAPTSAPDHPPVDSGGIAKPRRRCAPVRALPRRHIRTEPAA
ncbi:MAG: hypothetical protein NVS3B18_01620 [Candidatus Dormibacteria bacterium]